MKRHKLFIALTFLLVAFAEARSPYVRCFRRFERHSIDNYQPISEFFYISPHQCIDQCIRATNNAIKIGLCKSFVYNHLQHSCRLYDHFGSQIPAIVHPAIGYDLYRRTATSQECSGPLQRFFTGSDNSFAKERKEQSNDDLAAKAAAAPIQPGDDTVALRDQTQPAAPSARKFNLDEDIGGAPAARPEDAERVSAKRPRNGKAIDVDTSGPAKRYGANFLVVPRQKTQTSEAPSINARFRLPSTLRPASAYSRPCSTSTGFYLAKGNEMLVPQDLITQTHEISGIDQRACLQHCASNLGPSNETFKCASLNYDQEKSVCTLYTLLAQPHGQGKLVESTSSNYAEKFCLPRSQSRCPENAVFELGADRRLTRNVVASPAAGTLIDCLRACLNAEGCQCASFDSAHQQCLLHDSFSGRTSVAAPRWITIENGCLTRQQDQPSINLANDEEWSVWSTCRYKLGSRQNIRVRTRKCPNGQCRDGGALQIERCTP